MEVDMLCKPMSNTFYYLSTKSSLYSVVYTMKMHVYYSSSNEICMAGNLLLSAANVAFFWKESLCQKFTQPLLDDCPLSVVQLK